MKSLVVFCVFLLAPVTIWGADYTLCELVCKNDPTCMPGCLAGRRAARADYVICELSCGVTNTACINSCVQGRKRDTPTKRVDFVLCEMVICPNDNGSDSQCMKDCLQHAK
ncbi:uncharacterized protein LOC131937008 [Physella acuta]|uniref:uncharacterized protein LOC131937008 n=1 Tax=Physella acuta TaxID=109671 RepID=UPI0027DE0C7B|nr:uncharacterized protein LOC131937008 [Physella acuta]